MSGRDGSGALPRWLTGFAPQTWLGTFTRDHWSTTDVTVDPTNLPSFTDLHLPASLVGALARQQISVTTHVQAAVIPDALTGRDVLGRARTGSGKTLAFGIPLLARLAGDRSRPKHPRGLVIVPTRELANQVRQAMEPLAHKVGLRMATVYGGTPYDRQIRRLRGGVDIVVATPGRLEDLIRRGAVSLGRVEVAVLDEADHLCDLGFLPSVTELLGQTPRGGQRLLLSATLDGDVDAIVRQHLADPVLHEIDPGQAAVTTMDHHVLVVGPHNKVETACDLLRANPRSLVFTRTREGATELTAQFNEAGIVAVDLHGNLSQRVRERNLRRFASGAAQVVVATDVAARGIHVDGIGLVVHYDLPAESKAYLHRSGRTARAGRSGSVVTLVHHRRIGEIVKLHRLAGVKARHHDARTAPKPLTAEALTGFGVWAAEVQLDRPRQGGRAQRQPHRARRGRSEGHSEGRQQRRAKGRSHDARPYRVKAARRDSVTVAQAGARPEHRGGAARIGFTHGPSVDPNRQRRSS